MQSAKPSERGGRALKGIDKIKIIICIGLRAIVAIGAVLSLIDSDWEKFALSLLVLFTLFLPSIIEKKFCVEYPNFFEVIIVAFLFCSIYLGSINSFYDMIWWWDLVLHALSGIIIAAIGFSLVDILNSNERLALKLSPIFVALFSFSFALALGTIWEIFEFAMDSIFGMNMQKSGLVDTMWDLIVDAVGALIFSVVTYYKLKYKGRIHFRIRIKKEEITETAQNGEEIQEPVHQAESGYQNV